MEFSADQKKTGIIAAAAAIGVAQEIILKRTLDASTPNLLPNGIAGISLGTWGKPSVIVGIGAGAAALLLSLFVLKDHPYSNALAAYGGSALLVGVANGIGGNFD
jgi:hypothetical protein